MSCNHELRIHAYYDGELSPAERLEFEHHLAGCEICRQNFEQLQRLTTVLSRATAADLPLQVQRRLAAAWPAARDRSILRIAEWMTAAAAALLVAGLLSLNVSGSPDGVRPMAWETVAVASAPDDRAEGEPELVQVAQWMSDGLTNVRQ